MKINDVINFNTREQVVAILNRLYEEGYRYVVRDEESRYLNCYSLKPKKYRDMGSWGYINPESEGVMMAYPIKNTVIPEINWTNKSAMLIVDFINKESAKK